GGVGGVGGGDPSVDAMDPKLRRVEIFNATRQMLARAAEIRPHVLVLEDAHWLDSASEEWTARLAESLAAQRVLLVVTYRPGYSPPFGDHTFHTRLALTTLSSADSVRMSRDLLGADQLPPELEELIVSKAEGNPFFVEELVCSVEELGAVRREGTRMVVSRPLDAALMPDTVQDVVTARIDRLADPPRRALRVAAVIGREFTRRLLDRLVDSGPPLDDVLRELRAVELIHEQRVFPEVSYAFKHARAHARRRVRLGPGAGAARPPPEARAGAGAPPRRPGRGAARRPAPPLRRGRGLGARAGAPRARRGGGGAGVRDPRRARPV